MTLGGFLLPKLLKEDERLDLLKYFEYFFGLETSLFKDKVFFYQKDSIWEMTEKCYDFSERLFLSFPQGLKLCSGHRIYKPSFDFAQTYGKFCTKGFLELSRSQILSFFQRELLTFSELDLDRGYILIKYKKLFIGVGFYDGESLTSHYPKKLCSQISFKHFR